MDWIALGARVLLALVFAIAAAAKLADRRGTRDALSEFGIPATALSPLAVALPVAELTTAIALLITASARWAALAAIGLLALFSAGIGAALARGRAPDCHCFGRLGSGPVSRRSLLRNALIAVPAAFVVAQGPGKSIGSWLSARSPAELVAIGTGAVAVALAALCLRLWLDNRRLGRDLRAVEQEFAERPSGLPIGSPAPRFALPTLDGQARTLDALLARSRPVALVFLSSNCGACATLLPALARWQAALVDRVTIAPVAAGSLAEVRRLAEEHGLENVLVEDDGEVSRAYHVHATPSGVILTADGSIASDTTPTTFMVESLIRRALYLGKPAPSKGSPSETGAPLLVQHWSGTIGAR